MSQELTEDEFDDRFTTIESPEGETIWSEPGTAQQDPRTLWTVLDCEGDLYLVPGFAVVNRIGYVITKEPWDAHVTSVAWCISKDTEEDG